MKRSYFLLMSVMTLCSLPLYGMWRDERGNIVQQPKNVNKPFEDACYESVLASDVVRVPNENGQLGTINHNFPQEDTMGIGQFLNNEFKRQMGNTIQDPQNRDKVKALFGAYRLGISRSFPLGYLYGYNAAYRSFQSQGQQSSRFRERNEDAREDSLSHRLSAWLHYMPQRYPYYWTAGSLFAGGAAVWLWMRNKQQ